MAGGLWTRVKTWIDNENVTFTDLNAEFDNILANDKPEKSDDYSLTLTQMKIQTSPGAQGTESLATSLAGEIERIRYVISRIVGGTFWYDTPVKSLAATNADVAFHLPFDGVDASDAACQTMRRGAIANPVDQATNGFSSASMNSTNKKFGLFSFETSGANFLCVPGASPSKSEGALSLHFRNLSAGDYLAYNPQIGMELYVSAGGNLAFKQTLPTASGESAKNTKTITGTSSILALSTWKHALCKFAINGILGSGADVVAIKVDGTSEGAPLALDTIPANIGDGGSWYFGGRRNDPTWTHFYAASGLPSAHSSAWTFSGTAVTNAVSSGVLNLKTTDNTAKYTKNSPPDLMNAGGTIEFKLRLASVDGGAAGSEQLLVDNACTIKIGSAGRSRNCCIHFTRTGITFGGEASVNLLNVPVDVTTWHVYRVTFSAATDPVMTLYIDGIVAGTRTIISGSASNLLVFGDFKNQASNSADLFLEYLAYATGSVTVPVAAGASGQLDDILLLGEYISDSALDSTLATTSARTVLSKNSPALVGRRHYSNSDLGADFDVSSAVWVKATIAPVYFYSDGITPMVIHAFGACTNDTTETASFVMLSVDNKGAELQYTDAIAAGIPTAMMLQQGLIEVMPFHLSKKQVYPAGFHTLDIYLRTQSGTGDSATLIAGTKFVVSYER